MSLYGLPNSASISIARRRSWEAHGPSQEGMCLCRRIHLDRVAVELDRSIHLSPYLAAVGLPPEFRRSSQSRSFFHFSSSVAVGRLRPPLSCASEERGADSGSLPFAGCGADRCPGFDSLSLERWGNLREAYMASGRPSRLRASGE